MSTARTRSSGGARILAVDDVEAKRYAWEKILTRAGFEVFTASTGHEALRRVKENPDLVILDVRLPDLGGMEVCRRIKDEPATASIPVLHISASLVSSEDRAIALDGGADGYLTEPVDPEELVASVRALLRMRAAEEKARKSASEWRSTFDAIQDGLVVTDSRGTIARCNRAFAELVGRSFPDIVGNDLRELLVSDLKFPGKDLFQGLVDGGDRRSAEVFWGDRWIRVTLDPILQENAYAGSTGTFSDVTPRKAAECEVERGREELSRLNATLEDRVAERTLRLRLALQELEAFAYTVAHDLRAPLRSMHRFSESLLEEYGPSLDENGQFYAQRIAAGAVRMDQLIHDLLEYSRLTHSELHPERLDPAPLLEEAVCHLSIDPAQGTRVDIATPLPEVVGDRVLLSQVFLNLLSNAIKFVEPGTAPHVEVSAERGEDVVTLSVRDNGIGIADDARSRLFRVFERLVAAKDYPGTGIGLAIVRRSMERMGGECGVESGPGRGSRFWIRLPSPKGKGESP